KVLVQEMDGSPIGRVRSVNGGPPNLTKRIVRRGDNRYLHRRSLHDIGVIHQDAKSKKTGRAGWSGIAVRKNTVGHTHRLGADRSERYMDGVHALISGRERIVGRQLGERIVAREVHRAGIAGCNIAVRVQCLQPERTWTAYWSSVGGAEIAVNC